MNAPLCPDAMAQHAAQMRDQLSSSELSVEEGQALMRQWLSTHPVQAHAVLCLLYGLSWHQWAEMAHLFPDAQPPQNPLVWFMAAEVGTFAIQLQEHDSLPELLSLTVQQLSLENSFFSRTGL